MTIREYIRRRFWTISLVFALPYAALQVMRVALHFWPDALSAQPRALVLMLTRPVVLLVFVGWFVVRTLIIPCPRCRRPLGAAVTAIFGNKNVHRCPNCRVSLEEPAKLG
jgi:hypothetical protein